MTGSSVSTRARNVALTAACLASTIPISAFAADGVAASGESPSDEVVVTATRSERRLTDVPTSVSVVTSETIEDTPAKTLDDILRRTPSVDLPNASSYQLHPTADSVSMRGLGGSRALVLVDGVPIVDPFFGYVQWSQAPVENIERVEVVRGGGATLWGNYAMGGVINVLTRRPEETKLIVQGGGGNYGSYRTDAYGSLVASDNVRLGLDVGVNHTDGYMQVSKADRGPINRPTSFTAYNVAATGDVDLTPKLAAHGRVTYFRNDQNLITELQKNKQRTWTYSGDMTQSFGGNATLTLAAFGTDSHFRTDNPGTPAGATANEAEFVQNLHRTPVSDVGASLVWSQSFDNGWLRSYSVGTDYHRISGKDVADIFDETGAQVRTDIGSGKQRFRGMFAQASLKPVEQLEVLASLRYQSFRNFDAFDGSPGGLGTAPETRDTSVDPRISVRYSVSPVFALRGAYYTAFHAPSLDNLYRTFSVPQGIFYGSPILTPENLEGGEAGFDITTGALRLQVTAYRNTISNLITSRNLDFAELPPGFFFGSRRINAGAARAQGIEAEANWEIGSGFTANFGYTFADSKVTHNDLDPGSVGNQLGGVPRNRATASITYESPQGWRITPQFRWLQASFADNDHTQPVDSQTIVDLSASYPVTQALEAFVQVENLFDAHYVANNSGFNPPLRGTPLTAFVGVRVTLH